MIFAVKYLRFPQLAEGFQNPSPAQKKYQFRRKLQDSNTEKKVSRKVDFTATKYEVNYRPAPSL
jgi:hypothetical protein